MKPEERFTELARHYANVAGVALPGGAGGKGFGSTALRANGRIFAMLTRDRLVVKLPGERVNELVANGKGTRFDANKGRPMREWLVVEGQSLRQWILYSGEALEFVKSTS